MCSREVENDAFGFRFMVWYLWLKEGDCNSKFFHLKATASQRKNLIPSLNIDGVDVIDQNKKEDST